MIHSESMVHKSKVSSCSTPAKNFEKLWWIRMIYNLFCFIHLFALLFKLRHTLNWYKKCFFTFRLWTKCLKRAKCCTVGMLWSGGKVKDESQLQSWSKSLTPCWALLFVTSPAAKAWDMTKVSHGHKLNSHVTASFHTFNNGHLWSVAWQFHVTHQGCGVEV